MSKSAFAITVAKRPDAGNAGAQLIVHLDIARLIGFNARFVECQIPGVWHSPNRKQEMRSCYLLACFDAVQADSDLLSFFVRCYAFRIQANLDALFFQYFLYRLRNIFILTSDESRAHLYNGYFGSKAAIHLAELETDVAAADHNQMFWQKIHGHHAR